MAYKNININELGLKQRVTYGASKVVFLVPRLLAKLSEKLIVEPITKVVTGGESVEQVAAVATDVTLKMQAEEADEMQEKIDESNQNLEDWKNDQEYYVGNLAKYKSYQSTINDLVKKQAKLRTKPKRLLVAQNYLNVMKAYREKHKENKANEKMIKAIVEEYQMKKAEMEAKQLEIESLRKALSDAEQNYNDMQQGFNSFYQENSSIVSQISEQDAKEEQAKTM